MVVLLCPILGGNFALKPILKQTYQDLVGTFPYHAAIYTHTADIHELETLLKSCQMSRFMFLPIVILVLTWCNWNATPTSLYTFL